MVAADSQRDGSVPLSPGGGGGGSAITGVLTEGSFIQHPKPAFVDSPFGDRYVSIKPLPVSYTDVAARCTLWAFSVRGYQDYGTFTLGSPPGVKDGEQVLQDWYGHVRDMGKRALKYKHLPTTLTDSDMLIYWMDVYFYVVANLTTLLNLNRLPQYNAGCAYLSQYLPRYMSRVTRLWRRTSALKAPSFLKAHAIRSGLIIGQDNVLSPTLRLWSNKFLLAAGSGGPTITDIADGVRGMFASDAFLATFVTNLETAERWLEVGTATIIDDFIAMKDLIDMTSDIVPGTFTTGLPEGKDMPGIVWEPGIWSEYITRAYYTKDVVTAGTDRWIIFPIAAESAFASRIPIMGMGQPSIYDFTLLGAPKYGVFNASLATRSADVDTDVRMPGTDFWLRSYMTIASQDIRNMFGVPTGQDKENFVAYSQGTSSFYDAFDVNSAAAVRTWREGDQLRRMHPWSDARFWDRDSFPSGWQRIVIENPVAYVFWGEAEDLGWNYASLLGMSLGVPYYKSGG
jgi:hypothetical protein